MKKVLAMILTLSMLLALAACGGPAESATSAAASQQTEGNPSSTPDSPAENEATPAPAVRTVDADKDTLIVGGFGEVTPNLQTIYNPTYTFWSQQPYGFKCFS